MIFSHGKLTTILQYFTGNYDDYWHILYPKIDSSEREKDTYLYLYDISRKALDYHGEFSPEGIYYFLGYDGEMHIHALELSQYSLACWLAWRKTSCISWLDLAMKHCEWLVENQNQNGSWLIDHKNPLYKDLPSPWPSGMAQGLAISSLVRAFKYTNDQKFLTSAKKACEFLNVSVSDGGVRRAFSKDGVKGFIYEEYPREGLNGVLNGYITAIIGVYELSKVDESFSNMVSDNILNLKAILPLYDSGYWSYYALDGNLDSGFYHRYVITQLDSLSELDSDLLYFSELFSKYRDRIPNQIKAFYNKVKYKL